MPENELPDWRADRHGARVRVALWLVEEVGEGSTFTKAELRSAFPSVEQIDRRMRDLRVEGWILETNRDDPSLALNELRLARVGGPVWDAEYQSKAPTRISAKQRREVFDKADYRCAICAITGGESYADDPLRRAKLTVGSSGAVKDRSSALQCLCDRCFAGGGPAVLSTIDLGVLTQDDVRNLRQWMRVGRRESTMVDRVWAAFVQADEERRASLREELERSDRLA